MDNRVFVGSFTESGNEGIHVFSFDENAGRLKKISAASGIQNPSYLAVHPHRQVLYSTSEVRETDGRPEGKVIAWALDDQGSLSVLNEQRTDGGLPCHLSVDRKGEYLLAVNYRGGNVVMYPLGEQGEIGSMCENVQHYGSSVNTGRQESPHPHSVHIESSGTYAYTPDLGTDHVDIYRIDRTHHQLLKHAKAVTEPGAGPRQCCFHPNGNLLYTVNELNSTVAMFRIEHQTKEWMPVQTLSTLPDGYAGTNTGSDIHLTPSGDFLYASNRGHDSLAIFKVDASTGELALIGHHSTGGEIPHSFGISPAGTHLLVANMNSDTLVLFQLDPKSGALSDPVQTVQVSKPSCILFASNA